MRVAKSQAGKAIGGGLQPVSVQLSDRKPFKAAVFTVICAAILVSLLNSPRPVHAQITDSVLTYAPREILFRSGRIAETVTFSLRQRSRTQPLQGVRRFRLQAYEYFPSTRRLATRPSRDIIVTPSYLRLEYNRSEWIRVGLRSPRFANKGRQFRLIVTDDTPASEIWKPTTQQGNRARARIRSRLETISVPIRIVP